MDVQWPKTWSEAIPLVVFSTLVFAAGFEGINSLVHGNWLTSLASFVLMVGLLAMLIHWPQIREWRPSPGWIVAAAMTAIITIALLPSIEQRRWPFSTVFPAPPSAADIAKAVAPVSEQLGTVARQRDTALSELEALKRQGAALDRQLADARAELQKRESEVASARERIAQLEQQIPKPQMPGAPPPVRDPYPAGEPLQHKLVADDARVLLRAVMNVSSATIDFAKIRPPTKFFASNSPHSVGARYPWIENIKSAGFHAVINEILDYRDQLDTLNRTIASQVNSLRPPLNADLQRIMGQPGIGGLLQAIDLAIGRLRDLQKLTGPLESAFIQNHLEGSMSRLEGANTDFSQWMHTFPWQRASTARSLIESYL